jgi:hypothetical protein
MATKPNFKDQAILTLLTQNSPTPWTFDDRDDRVIRDANGSAIAQGFRGDLSRDDADLNGRLMAVAPSMLTIVRWIVDHAEIWRGGIKSCRFCGYIAGYHEDCPVPAAKAILWAIRQEGADDVQV